MSFDVVIINGTIVKPDSILHANIGIRDEKIVAIFSGNENINAKRIIDAKDSFVLPGLIDTHVHFHLPIRDTFSSDDFNSGSKAGLFGGVTTYIDFTNQTAGESLIESFNNRLLEIKGNSFSDYSLHSVINSWKDEYEKEIKKLIELGVRSFKFFMYSKNDNERWDDALLYKLAYILKKKALVILHAENGFLINEFTEMLVKDGQTHVRFHGSSRPPIVEAEAVRRAAFIVNGAGGIAKILHLSSKEGLLEVMEARKRGMRVMCETCPQYLLLDDSIYRMVDGYLFATCPPVRSRNDNEVLWEALANGEIQQVVTDHCPFLRDDKDTWYNDFRKLYFGIPGIENTLSLLYTYGVVRGGRININDIVRLCSYNPSRIYGLSHVKGNIEVGKDADIVVFNPEYDGIIYNKDLHMNCDYNPYEYWDIKGKVTHVLLRGKIMIDNGNFVADKPCGNFIPRKKPEFI